MTWALYRRVGHGWRREYLGTLLLHDEERELFMDEREKEISMTRDRYCVTDEMRRVTTDNVFTEELLQMGPVFLQIVKEISEQKHEQKHEHDVPDD